MLAACEIGLTEQTYYYRRRKKYGGMKIDHAPRLLKEVGEENCRLRELVADLSLDNTI